jgi:hypothetical protein
VTLALSGTAAFAQSGRWPAGLEQQERMTTRELNIEQANQPTQYAYPSAPTQTYTYVSPPQYSYVPAPPTYSYAPPPMAPAYAYPYDYPPRPWHPRYY